METQDQLQLAQERYSRQTVHANTSFKVGDYVWVQAEQLLPDRLRNRSKRKLLPQRHGPFEIIERVGSTSYRLTLPPELARVSPVFHVTVLKLAHDKYAVRSRPLEPEPDIIDGHREYEVECILDMRTRRHRTEYLVRWKGFSEANDLWVPERNLINAKEALKAFKSARA